MDVRKWLQDTVGPGPAATLTLAPGREAREEPDQEDGGASSHPTRRCNHLLSDSSLLHVDCTDDVQGFSAHQPDHIGRSPWRSLDEDRPTTTTSSDALDSHQQEHVDPYTRRPRRKTRPEIYEPRPGLDREKTKRRRKTEKEGQRKKAAKSQRRAGKDKPPHQTHVFQPKNVTKERLTMKPNQSIGLFKKGRASTPIKGRGLPDLVFSEMRFLQKQDDTKEKSQEETRSKRKRKDSNQVQEQEISAYFGTRRPPLVDGNQNNQHRRLGRRSKAASLTQRPLGRASTRLESAKSTIELPDKPYLGFGSRGVDPVASDPTYYIPWSESVRNASIQPSDATLPPPRPSLRPHTQGTKARELNDGHCGRTPGASGNGILSQRVEQVAKQFKGGNGLISAAIRHSVERRQGDSVAEMNAKRSAPLTSTTSPGSVPEKEPRQGNESRRSTGHLEESVPDADLGKGEIDCTVKSASKLHEPSRPVPDRVDRHVLANKTQANDAVSLNVGSNENDSERGPALQRPSSPLDRLLRDCDDACNEFLYAQNHPALEEPVLNAPAKAEDDRVEELYKAHHASLPQRWASGKIPGQPTFYERQGRQDDAHDELHQWDGEDDLDRTNSVDVGAGTDMGEIRGWSGNDMDEIGAQDSGYRDMVEQWSVVENGVAHARDDVGELQWSWRRHRLY